MPERFLDIYMPLKVPGLPCISSPRWKTTIQVSAGGNETPNQDWAHPLHHFLLPEAIARDWETVRQLGDHWFISRGPFHTWPWRNPLDFASADLVKPNQVPTVTMTDQLIGEGDGFTDAFQLVKTYSRSGETYERTIHLPVLDTVLVAIGGVLVPPADYSVSRPGGIVTFDVPPGDSQAITAGFLFDVEVRFESDDAFEGILRALRVGAFADLNLIEARPC